MTQSKTSPSPLIAIVEKDPIVRLDITETLSSEFGADHLISVQSLADLPKIVGECLVIDHKLDPASLSLWLAQGAGIVATYPKIDDEGFAATDGVFCVPRPFRQDDLLEAVRRALAA